MSFSMFEEGMVMADFPSNRRGLTLIETVMALMLAGFVFLSLAVFMKVSQQAWSGSSKHSDLVQHARVAMSRIVDDLRYANQWQGYIALPGAWVFATTNLTQGGTAVMGVQYKLEAGRLRRKINNEPWQVIAGSEANSNIQVVSFTPIAYAVDASNNLFIPVLAQDAKYIEVTIGLRDEYAKEFFLRSGVDLRNK